MFMPSVQFSLFKTMFLAKKDYVPPFTLHPRAVCPVVPAKTRFYNQSNAENNKKHLEFGKFSIKRMFFWKVLLPLHHNCNNLWKKILY